MATIKNTENWSFETKQLHIGQETADPVTDARACHHIVITKNSVKHYPDGNDYIYRVIR